MFCTATTHVQSQRQPTKDLLTEMISCLDPVAANIELQQQPKNSQDDGVEETPKPPTLELLEQPAHSCRFRPKNAKPQSDVTGLLLGRTFNNGLLSPMQLRIANLNPIMYVQLYVTVSIVASVSKAPHPYLLHGDNCHDGFFELTLTSTEIQGQIVDIAFSGVAVISVPVEDIRKELTARREKLPHLFDCPELNSVNYDARNVGKIRLAFSLTYADPNGSSWVLPTLFSDEIASADPVLFIEQPVQFYRFRYESEVEKGRVGGLLQGRNGNDKNKSFMKLSISNISHMLHSQLRLTVCTVDSESKAPHPYYLHGDNCRDGYFEMVKTVDERVDQWNITFDRLAVICVPKKKEEDIRQALRTRIEHVPQLHDCPKEPPLPYNARNLGRIRLAFSLNYVDTEGISRFLPTLFSDEIAGDKEKKSVEVDCLIPAEVPMKGGTLVAIYTRSPTTGIKMADICVEFRIKGEVTGFVCAFQQRAEELKKHLILVRTPDIRGKCEDERQKCEVAVCSNGFTSESLNLNFDIKMPDRCSSDDQQKNSRKRVRKP